MVTTNPQPASPQIGTNESIVTLLYTIEGIINRASNHYVSQDDSVYCGQKPKGHGIVQHKDELKPVPKRLEEILQVQNISGDEWLAMQNLIKILRYATADKFDWGIQKWFDMLKADFKEIYDRVLNAPKLDRTAAPPPVYPRPKGKSGGEGLETSKT